MGEAYLGLGAKGDAAGEGIRGRGGVGLWVRGVAPGTPDPPKESGAVGKAPGRGRVARVRRVQGAGAGIYGAVGKALEAHALDTPPLRLDGVAGAVAGVVEHGRGPGVTRLAAATAAAAAASGAGGAAAASSSSELELGAEMPEPATRAAAARAAAARRLRRGVTVRHSEPAAGVATRRAARRRRW